MQLRQPADPARKFYQALAFMLAILAIGTAGYSLIEGWNLLDSIYMTVITLSTIGFQEVAPLSDAGRVFTIVIVILSITTLAYAVNAATRLLVSGEIRNYMEHRRMRRSMEKMENHYVVCGFGRIGRRICELFKMENVSCLVIERSPETAEEVRSMGIPVVNGEATDESVLREAGVERARCIITAVDSPADNVFIVLTARDINPGIHIVARAESEKTGSKLKRAGADRAVYPHQIGGRRMAMAALRPTLDRFLSMDTLRMKYNVYMEEIHLAESSELVGSTLAEAAISRRFGLTIIAILEIDQAEDNVIFNPGSETRLLAGSTLIVLGTEEQLRKLEKLASGKPAG